MVIVGGGFAGLAVARGLDGARVRVTLVDKENYHLFQPLLYQVATAGLSPGGIATPIRSLLAGRENVEVHLGEVTGADLGRSEVHVNGAPVKFDYLVLAAGVRHAYFGHSHWEPWAPGLKTLDDALEIRRRVLLAYEAAELEKDEARRKALLTFVVVGGGPTGVELAGALAELAKFTLKADFRAIDTGRARVVLVEAGPRVLSTFPERLSKKAEVALTDLGVEVRTNARVTDVGGEGVRVGDELIPSASVLWAAGVQGPAWAKSLGVALDNAGRIVVDRELRVPGHPNVFVAGDLASLDLGGGVKLPGLAPAAMQTGKHVAQNLRALLDQEPPKPFSYFDKGTMATIGRAAGIAEARGLQLWGFVGWVAWLFIHLLFLVGFRNKVIVLIEWAWAYLTYGRGARLVTGLHPPPRPKLPGAPGA